MTIGFGCCGWQEKNNLALGSSPRARLFLLSISARMLYSPNSSKLSTAIRNYGDVFRNRIFRCGAWLSDLSLKRVPGPGPEFDCLTRGKVDHKGDFPWHDPPPWPRTISLRRSKSLKNTSQYL